MKIAVLAVLVLVGCATPQQRAMQDVRDFGPVCRTYGYEPGSPQYAACIERASRAQRAEVEADLKRLFGPKPTVQCHSVPDYLGGYRTVCQ